MAHFDKAESIATNTLLLPDIPPFFFGCDDALLLIHDAFAAFGPIYTFVQMKGFRRLMIIFQETAHAMKAKTTLDKHHVIWKERTPFPEIISLVKDYDKEAHLDSQDLLLRVYYGQHYSIDVDPNSTSLQVPQFQRNLLISPPGSPFEGWEQIEEDAPNQVVLGSDLIHAAEISDYELDEDELRLEVEEEIKRVAPPKKAAQPKKIAIVCSKGLEHPEHLPSITVQDWDGHITINADAEDLIKKPKKMTVANIIPTAMPPR